TYHVKHTYILVNSIKRGPYVQSECDDTLICYLFSGDSKLIIKYKKGRKFMNNKLLLFSSSAIATGLLLGASSTAQANEGMNMNQDMHGDMNQNEMNMKHDMKDKKNQNDMNMNNDMKGNMKQNDMNMNHDMNGNMNQNDMGMNHDMNGNMNQNDIDMDHDMNGNMNQNDMGMNHDMKGNMNQNDRGMDHMAQETMMPYYNYNGYTTYDGQFTQDYNFVRALKYDNVMIDGYKVNTAASDKTVDSSKKVDSTMVDMNKDGQVVHITFDTKPNTVNKDMFKKAHMSNHMTDEGKTDNGSYMAYETNNGMY